MLDSKHIKRLSFVMRELNHFVRLYEKGQQEAIAEARVQDALKAGELVALAKKTRHTIILKLRVVRRMLQELDKSYKDGKANGILGVKE
jgi:glutamyl-tRNA reductase